MENLPTWLFESIQSYPDFVAAVAAFLLLTISLPGLLVEVYCHFEISFDWLQTLLDLGRTDLIIFFFFGGGID